MKAAVCATASGMDSCKAASEKPEQVGASGYWFRDRISQGQSLSCGNHKRMAKTLSNPDKMGLAREVSMLKQGFCCLTLLSVVASPVVLQLCVILIFLSKVNGGCTEMPSPARQAICCPALTSPPLHAFHMDISRDLTWLTGRHTWFMSEATQKWSLHRRPGLLVSPYP